MPVLNQIPQLNRSYQILTNDCDMYLIQLFLSIAFSSYQMNAFVLYILKSLMSDTAAYGATHYNTSSQ